MVVKNNSSNFANLFLCWNLLFQVMANKHNKSMLLKVKCMAKTRHAFAFSKLWRYNFLENTFYIAVKILMGAKSHQFKN